MRLTLAEIAEIVGGVVIGDGGVEVTGVGTLDGATAGQITFIDSADKLGKLAQCAASAVVIPAEVSSTCLPAVRVSNVVEAFTAIALRFRPPRDIRRPGVSSRAFVSPSAVIGENVDIYDGAFVGDGVHVEDNATIHSGAQIQEGCRIGPNVVIYSGAVLYPDTIVGARSVIHACAVLGANGFGYRLVDGRHQLSAQLGWVEIGEDVEIGANTTIDRGAFCATRIGDGTKIDNLVQIGHNCIIGKHNLICGEVGIAGSCVTGDYVVIAGGAGLRDHLHIGEKAVLGAFSGVANDVPAGAVMLGIPAIPMRDQKLQFAALSKLPEMRKQLKALQATVDQMQTRGRDLGGQAAA